MKNLVHETDFQLAQRVVNGSQCDYEEFYNIYKPKVFFTCLKMTKDYTLSEDLCQDVLISIHRKLDSYQGKSRLSTWIYRLTVNTVLMYYRSSKKTLYTVSIDEKLEEQNMDLGIGGQTFIDPLTSLSLQEAIDNLPPGYKSILILHDYLGYEHREAAKIMKTSDGTSKSQLFKARKATKKLLNKKINPKVYVPAKIQSC